MNQSARPISKLPPAAFFVVAITVFLIAARCTMLFGADKPTVGEAASSAEPLRSGLQAGEKVRPFYVRAITGPLKNKSVCYVCRNGDRPVVMIVIRKITPELKTLIKGIDGEIDQHRAAGLRAFGVFLAGDGNELLPQVQTLAFDGKINLPLTIAAAPFDGSAGGTIHPEAAVTVMLYRDQIVTSNFAYRPFELHDREIDRILKGIRALANE